MTKAPRVLLALAALASVLIIVNAASSGAIFGWASAPILMPLLVIYVLLARPRPTPKFIWLLIAAQVLSWFGDIALAVHIDALFLVGVGCFLLAQICYILTFRAIRPGPHLLSQRKLLLIPYLVYFLAMMAVVLPSAGVLAPALVIYGAILLSMAAMALDAWPRVPPAGARMLLVGSILFVISDSLIAVTKFGPVPENAPVATVLIGTYCVAQILLMLGVMTATSPQALSQHDQPVAPAPTP